MTHVTGTKAELAEQLTNRSIKRTLSKIAKVWQLIKIGIRYHGPSLPKCMGSSSLHHLQCEECIYNCNVARIRGFSDQIAAFLAHQI
jgi:hypothetical protein